jgi:triacylglycerol lipase
MKLEEVPAVSFPIAANARGALQLARETVESWRVSANEQVWSHLRDDSVLLLHGLAGTPRMMHPLRNYLRCELSRPAIDLPLGVGFGDIRDLAIRVHRELVEQRVRCCDVVGYSMGGLVAAYLVKCLDQGRAIRRVITIGTPHRGVPCLAEWWWWLARWFRSANQMREGCDFLEQLGRMPIPHGTTFLSIAGATDTVVPPECANVEGAGCRNLVVPGLDHWTLPTSRRTFRCVKEVLEPARPALRIADLTPERIQPRLELVR